MISEHFWSVQKGPVCPLDQMQQGRGGDGWPWNRQAAFHRARSEKRLFFPPPAALCVFQGHISQSNGVWKHMYMCLSGRRQRRYNQQATYRSRSLNRKHDTSV